ncbi:dihydrodipicolinate synthase family protein [Alteribacillus sp. JSM 102045]|uniref:dihydrodipicolinate synthase family protein n=1 Tax=Alteribacillus sp. JSM 102045 TaxID=1562101 RepID=UPI0035BFC69D
MTYKKLAKNLETICAINITPFYKDTKEIDWGGLEENIQFLLKHGTEVIVPNGNTGEFYALTLEEAKQQTRNVVDIVQGRATVVAGVGYSVNTAIELGKDAQEAGADCVMIHQPIHPYVTTDGAISYFKKIIEALDIPSIIYFKDPHLSDDVIKELAPLEKFIGIKYAINDLPRFKKVIREVPEEHNLAWICGTAEKWAPFFYNAGAKGFTSGIINIYPESSFAMLNGLREGDHEMVWKVWEETLDYENLRAKYNNGNNVVVIKESMAEIGMNSGVTREPVNPLNEEDKKEVEEILESWNLLNKVND